MPRSLLTRRALLGRSLALGCSLAASPLVTPVTFANAPRDARLVVIILRGGMDGLDVVRPVGDPDFAALRGPQAVGEDGGPLPLDGFFALHPALADLLPMWQAGELGFAHAVSTPYRDKRSHFDGQDLLEAGTAMLGSGARDGWLNRLLQVSGASDPRTAFAVGHDDMKLLSGAAPVSVWSPDVDLELSPQALELADYVMRSDPAFLAAFRDGIALADGDGDPVSSMAMQGDMADMAAEMKQAGIAAGPEGIARFAARQLRADARIAAFSLGGWDTHSGQHVTLSKALQPLSTSLVALRDELGPVWSRTAVVAMTEFGRTARLNGTRGTDHGTGGVMLTAGGALRGGRVIGDWPGLDEVSLLDRRDLTPTRDLRAHAAWIMRGLFGVASSDLERSVFPGLDMGGDPGLLL